MVRYAWPGPTAWAGRTAWPHACGSSTGDWHTCGPELAYRTGPELIRESVVVLLMMASPSQELEPPAIPARFSIPRRRISS